MKVKIVNITDEITNDKITGKEVRDKLTLIGGKAAGICYMPDGYLSEGIQDEEKAMARSKRNAKSGHYSVFEHGHISFIIETSKAMAMILNSMRLYSTSEKSARYTSMKPGSEIEQNLYDKWTTIFNDLIDSYYGKVRTASDINKLARENARYMISVFTPTVMEYTVPFNRAILMCGWLDDLANTIELINSIKIGNYLDNTNSIKVHYDKYYSRVKDECRELAGIIRGLIGITEDDYFLRDHKAIGIDFFRPIHMVDQFIKMNHGNAADYPKFAEVDIDLASEFDSYYGNSYTSNYKASFACVAQAQRHRTLDVSINIPDKLECYVPKIIKGSRYEAEWIEDFESLVAANIMPQGALLEVCERGRFEDFVLKCKERLCNRAQLEIMEVTREQVTEFACREDQLSYFNKMTLNNMITINRESNADYKSRIEVLARCQIKGYCCNEPCGLYTPKINYYRNA